MEKLLYAKDEKVVNPPQRPTVKKIRHSGDKFPPLSENAYIIPIIRQPVILATNVPHGKVP